MKNPSRLLGQRTPCLGQMSRTIMPKPMQRLPCSGLRRISMLCYRRFLKVKVLLELCLHQVILFPTIPTSTTFTEKVILFPTIPTGPTFTEKVILFSTIPTSTTFTEKVILFPKQFQLQQQQQSQQ